MVVTIVIIIIITHNTHKHDDDIHISIVVIIVIVIITIVVCSRRREAGDPEHNTARRVSREGRCENRGRTAGPHPQQLYLIASSFMY